MERVEKRQHQRKPVSLTTYIRQTMPDGKNRLRQFESRDLSSGGVFITTEDLSLYDIGEDLEIIVTRDGQDYYMGGARVVRSAKQYESGDDGSDSGFGLCFVEPDDAFSAAVSESLRGA